MSGTPMESSELSQLDAVNMLLNIQAPEEASEDTQEQTAETEVEATEADAEEVEAVDDQAETDDADVEVEAEEVSDEAEFIFDASEHEDFLSRVKIDGEESNVSQSDLIAAYQKNQSADRRLQQAAEERKGLETEKASIDQLRQKYSDGVQKLEQFLEDQSKSSLTDKQIDELHETDPFEALRLEREQRKRADDLRQVRAERERVENETRASEGEKLKRLLPGWDNPETAKSEAQALTEYVSSKGFTSETIGAMSLDARFVEIAVKAMKFDGLQTKKPMAQKKVRAAPKMVKPGVPKPAKNSATDRKRKAFEKLKKTGSRSSAVEYLLTQ